MPSQPLMWTGRELDETGLYYLRGRYYSPTLGRFISEDPAGLGANIGLASEIAPATAPDGRGDNATGA